MVKKDEEIFEMATEPKEREKERRLQRKGEEDGMRGEVVEEEKEREHCLGAGRKKSLKGFFLFRLLFFFRHFLSSCSSTERRKRTEERVFPFL